VHLGLCQCYSQILDGPERSFMLPATQHTFVEVCRLALVQALLAAAPLAKAFPVRPCPKGLDWKALPVRPCPKGLDWEALPVRPCPKGLDWEASPVRPCPKGLDWKAPKAAGPCELAAVLAAPKGDISLWAVVPNANAP